MIQIANRNHGFKYCFINITIPNCSPKSWEIFADELTQKVNDFITMGSRTLLASNLQGNGGFDADRTNLGLGALSNSLGLQSVILDYGVRTNFKSARTISQFNNLRPRQQA